MNRQWTVADALAWGRQQLPTELARDAELLLRAGTGWDKAFLLAHAEALLTAEAEAEFRVSIQRRAAGEPVQYILGRQEFWGMEFHVTPAVLIPRPETEHLIEAVLAKVSRDASVSIADVGTGSGAIAVTLAKELPLAKILATDISQEALQIARDNGRRHGVSERVEFLHCDLLPASVADSLDFVVSNPPYIAESERDSLPREVRDFEPGQALFAGADGLAVYHRLIPAAGTALKSGGWLVMEMGAGQSAAMAALLSGWENVEVTRDLQGIERVVCARKPALRS